MGFILFLLGAFLIAAVYKGTYPELGKLLAQDAPGFAVWALALIFVGAFGFIPKARPVATAFLVLIFVAMVLKNGGVFDQLSQLASQGIPSVSGTGLNFGNVPLTGSSAPGSSYYAPQGGGGPQSGGGWFSNPQAQPQSFSVPGFSIPRLYA